MSATAARLERHRSRANRARWRSSGVDAASPLGLGPSGSRSEIVEIGGSEYVRQYEECRNTENQPTVNSAVPTGLRTNGAERFTAPQIVVRRVGGLGGRRVRLARLPRRRHCRLPREPVEREVIRASCREQLAQDQAAEIPYQQPAQLRVRRAPIIGGTAANSARRRHQDRTEPRRRGSWIPTRDVRLPRRRPGSRSLASRFSSRCRSRE